MVREFMRKTGDKIEAVLKVWQVAIFTVSIFCITFEVFMRFVLNSPTSWSEELARFTMVWLALLGLGTGIRRKDHIRIDNIIDVFPKPIRALAAWVRYIVTFIFSLVLLVYGFRMAMINMTQITPGLAIPMGYVYMAVPIGAFLMLFYLLELVVEGYRGTF